MLDDDRNKEELFIRYKIFVEVYVKKFSKTLTLEKNEF